MANSSSPDKDSKGIPAFRFFTEVRSELLKCIWPTREQVTRFTALVIVIALGIGFALGAFDLGFFNLLTSLREWTSTLT